jgi:DNA-binding transcriptional LysR family regulator
MPELRHLRYFVAVAEELNFSRAARRLQMAQPPLSVAIRQLEQELGTELFSRTSREVRLTEPGRVLLDGARRTLAEADRAVAAARRAGAGELGRVSVAFSWSARFETLPSIARAFRARRPDVELLAQEMWNSAMIPALRSGDVDIAVSLCPEPAPDLDDELLRTERLVALVASDHPAAQQQQIALGSLSGDALVLFPRELAPRLYDELLERCRLAGFEPRIRRDSLHAGWELGLLGDIPGVAIAPASVASELPEGIVAVALRDSVAPLETRLLWRRDGLGPAVDAFRSVARATIPRA